MTATDEDATPPDFHDLAVFNAETARGIVHTPEYWYAMKAEQERFDELRQADTA